MNELEKLKEILNNSGIPFTVDEDHYLPNVIIERDGRRLCDAIIPPVSNGSYLEIMGAMTVNEAALDSVLTGLKAEEVFKRFKYCYENKTSRYHEN